jgi:diketogulonate reductase-like aldo/keto reductase
MAAGYRVIDTSSTRNCHSEINDGQQLATSYRDSLIAAARSDVFLQTKFAPSYAHRNRGGEGEGEGKGEDAGGVRCMPFHAASDPPFVQVLRSALRSAEDLQTEWFDMYLLHYPMEKDADTLEAWSAMEAMHDRGAARYLGLCHATPRYLEWIWKHARIKPAAVQNAFSKAARYDEEVMGFCRRHGLVYQAFGVFSAQNQDLLSFATVLSYAQRYAVTARQALGDILTAMYASDGISFFIIDGTSNAEHMKENLAGLKYQSRVTEVEMVALRNEMKANCKEYFKQ